MTPDPAAACKELANKLSNEEGADILFLNHPMMAPMDSELLKVVEGRKKLHKKLYVIVVSEGGHGEVAYRACRMLQRNYTTLVCVVSGWCKSAGTLFCAGAHQVVFGPRGEMGPIDVQLRRSDEIGERDSGLSVDAAFEGLMDAAFKVFERFALGIKRKSGGSVTFKTAAAMAAEISVGLVAPILSQLDPIKVGEIHRSVRVAEQYARRLAITGGNVIEMPPFDAINTLVRGYPSHGFVIDLEEAKMIFHDVIAAEGTLLKLLTSLEGDAIEPIDAKSPASIMNSKMEYLNDDPSTTADAEPKGSGGASEAGPGS